MLSFYLLLASFLPTFPCLFCFCDSIRSFSTCFLNSSSLLTLFLCTVWGDLTPTQGMTEIAKSLHLAYPLLALGSFKPSISTKTFYPLRVDLTPTQGMLPILFDDLQNFLCNEIFEQTKELSNSHSHWNKLHAPKLPYHKGRSITHITCNPY